jgi:hypothetical protein
MAERTITQFITPISEAEMICRMLEAGEEMTRPEGRTAAECLDALEPDTRAMLHRMARAAMDYWCECINTAQATN